MTGVRAGGWSLDARVMVRPASAFGSIAHPVAAATGWSAWRRPIFVAVVMGCIVSLVTSGTLTVRLTASAMSSWAVVPAIEALALMLVILDALRDGRTVVYDRGRAYGDPALIALASGQQLDPGGPFVPVVDSFSTSSRESGSLWTATRLRGHSAAC